MKDISIVIPFLNEREGIHALMDQLEKFTTEYSFSFEVIFVDDGSTDNTCDLIRDRSDTSYPCKLVRLSRNFGSHAAIRAGFIQATGNYTVYLPADLQISFDALEKMYAAACNGYEVVTGIRKVNEIGKMEKIFSRSYARLMRRYVNSQFPYEGIETILIAEKVRTVFNQNVEGNSSFALQILGMGYRSTFVNIEKSNRKIGKSKWSMSKKIKLMIDSFMGFSYAPIRFVTLMGASFFVVGILWTAYILLRKIITDDLQAGWPMLMSVLLVGFGLTNISLGIIAEYLWRTLDAARKRPVFIIDTVEEINKI